MLNLDELKRQFNKIDFREKRTGLYKILVPFFHEDGDMYDMFVEESPTNDSLLRVSDYGLTLMKLSYNFDLDTENKREVFNSIISQNRCFEEKGNIFFDVAPKNFQSAIYQMAQVIAKITNMDIISKEAINSYFYEFLQSFIYDCFGQYNVKQNTLPLKTQDLKVDFELPIDKKPIYIFGVNDNNKASRVVISCLRFNIQKLPYRSLVIHEDLESLSAFNRREITNTADKQFASLDDFKEQGLEYVQREIAS